VHHTKRNKQGEALDCDCTDLVCLHCSSQNWAFFCQAVLQRATFCRRRCSLAFISFFKSAPDRISKTLTYVTAGCAVWPYSEKRSNLDRHPTGYGGLAPPCQGLVQVNGFQQPESAHVLLGLQVRPVGDEHLAIGLCPQRLRAAGFSSVIAVKRTTNQFRNTLIAARNADPKSKNNRKSIFLRFAPSKETKPS